MAHHHPTRPALTVAFALVVLLGATAPPAMSTSAAGQSLRLMVALVLGQSNAANFGAGPRTAGRGVYNLYHGWLYRARDPLRGANGQGGSVWTRLGDRLIGEKLFDTVIFVPAAVGATEIAQWTPEGPLHPLILKAIEDAKRRRLKITHVFWHQGESDAYLRTSGLDYQKRFLAILGSLREHGVDAPAFVSVATRCGQYPASAEIQWAQRELVNPSAGIFAGPDTDQLDEHYRHDGCHFSSEGLDVHAGLWVNQIKAYTQWLSQTQQTR